MATTGAKVDFQPFLQIVHISDMHVVAPSCADVISDYRTLIRALPENGKEWVREQSAPHDRFSLSKFSKFLLEITAKDKVWSELATWMVDTGDITTYGDFPSLDEGHAWLRRFQTVVPKTKLLYGNHDAWPEKFPLLAGIGDIKRHRERLRREMYPQTLPDEPLKQTIPGSASGAEVQLWSLNSVIHERLHNSRALGEVQEDRFWETDASGARSPANAIRQLAAKVASGAAGRHFRILATHHPIHYPKPKPLFTMIMRNDAQVADDLSDAGKPNHVPVAHLILSGHTHELFPPLGKLPDQTSVCYHTPLKHSQCQMIAASLSQRGPPDAQWPQQCQVLRLYYSPDQPTDVLVERLIGARANGLGDYGFVELPNGNDAEEILIGF